MVLCLIIWAVILIFVVIAAFMPRVLEAIVYPIIRQVLEYFWH